MMPHIDQITIASICGGFAVVFGSRDRCGQCHKRIYFWQSRAVYSRSVVERVGWFHTDCDSHVGAANSPGRA